MTAVGKLLTAMTALYLHDDIYVSQIDAIFEMNRSVST